MTINLEANNCTAQLTIHKESLKTNHLVKAIINVDLTQSDLNHSININIKPAWQLMLFATQDNHGHEANNFLSHLVHDHLIISAFNKDSKCKQLRIICKINPEQI